MGGEQAMPSKTAPRGRIAYFDIARGVAMLAVIVGHSSAQGIPWPIVNFCYSFDMPLFFFISGYFCRPDVRLDARYVAKNARALLLPYLWTSIILLALFAVRGLLIPEQGGGVLELLQRWSLACLYGAGGQFAGLPAGIIGIGALWYLLALFWAKLLLALANRLPGTPVIVAALFVLGYASTNWVTWLPWLPWSIRPALCATLFLYLGQLAHARGLFERGALHPAAWVAMLLIWLVDGIWGGPIYLVSNEYGHGVFDLVGGVFGALCVIKGCQLFERRFPRLVSVPQAFGSITLPVFCMHLVEMNVLPWDLMFEMLVDLPGPVVLEAVLLRCAIIALLTGALWLLPRPISGAFFAARRDSVQAPH